MFPIYRAAIHAVTNLRPHADQSCSRDFCYMLTHFLSVFGNRAPQRVDNRHQTLHRPSAQKCHSPFPPNHREPQIIAHQKVMSKALEMSAWRSIGTMPTDGHRPISPHSPCAPERQAPTCHSGRSRCLLLYRLHNQTTSLKENGALRSMVWPLSRSHRNQTLFRPQPATRLLKQ
jgi:hypothetical protein